MQFQVPQFIETEDKIVGPLTLRQFLYVAAAFGICFILFFLFQFWLWLIFASVIVSTASAFAFLKINGRPFTVIFFSAFNFYWKPQMYIWKRETKITMEEPTLKPFSFTTPKPVVDKKKLATGSGLSNLWQNISTAKTAVPEREKPVVAPRDENESFVVRRRASGEREVVKRVDFR